jgi:hypothetical protein
MSLTENLLRTTLRQLQQDDSGQHRRSQKRFVGIRGDRWTGPESLDVEGETFCVRMCATPLAVRSTMDAWPADGPRLVVVTPCNSNELGCDVEARVLNNRFQQADAWLAVTWRFGAERLAPNVPREAWLRDFLLAIPESDLPRLQTSRVLDRDSVRQVALHSLGIAAPQDLRALLAWAGSTTTGQLLGRPRELQHCVRAWIEETLGVAGGAIVDAVLAGNGDKAVTIGLVLRVLAPHGQPSPTRLDPAVTARAEGRLEALLGGRRVHAIELQPWIEAAEERLLTDLATARGRANTTLDAADQLLEQLGVRELAGSSNVLRHGRSQREQTFADGVRRALADPDLGLAEVERSTAALLRHALLREDHGSRTQAIPMVGRLLRWLRTTAAVDHDFRGLAMAYAEELSFVDQARERLDYPGPAQAVLREVWHETFRRRELFNERFAAALVKHTAAAARDEVLIPLERVIDEVVAPLAAQCPVLLVVLDGMSLPIFHEIVAGFLGWTEVGPSRGESRIGQRRYGVAVLPTITEVSRTSLLSGKITSGNQGTEKAAFAAHPALRIGKHAPILFHKEDLTDSRVGLSDRVVQAVAGSQAPAVVGVVVNAIDDWLGKGDQDAAAWNVERIKPLVELLQCAGGHGRAVIVTSDHGHVREHLTEMADGDGGTRFRSAGTPRQGEIRLRGPRVGALGGEITAPWTETIRYTPSKQNGYHGGVTPQEVLVPLSVFVRTGVELAGHEPVPVQQPAWWDATELTPVPQSGPTTPPKPPTVRGTVRQPAEVLPFGNVRRDLIESLLGSSLYAAQAAAAGRMRVDDQRVRDILMALSERGDTLTEAGLAAKLQLPQQRVTGYLSGLRRVLNLDGVESIEVETASRTVRVHWTTLTRQFGLDEVKK